MIDAVKLFEAYGFEKLDDGLWRFASDYKDNPEATVDPDRVAVLIVEARADGSFSGHVPFAQYSRTDLAEIPPKSLFFASLDPRDIVALAQNEAGSAYCQATGLYPDEGFDDDGASEMFITFPFMSDPWCDYAIATGFERDDAHIGLVDPATVYDGYVAWRDEFCDRILAGQLRPAT